ncbi:hypothetical protein AXE80_13675 [Wenyingzhuangia fucanilytica]|uniref:Translocation and assembly module TamB C-terminal domain-containing protein n=1 Tax=Wenyingzhuangia fucanilytica TaxID=1790137 RepID=A0A1B1Y928_9FLAO|nr:translocation/assembly module TamB domain-containing protein [Wenyingzhuangia fucanilytica]ANW97277.1 hypothetical protein AXE80_13675 [Wenyingzhuangia fucanilytica]
MPKTILHFLKKAVHFFKWMFLGLLGLFVILVFFIRSPWGQNLIKNKITEFVSEKIETNFSIEKIYLGFSGNLIIEELYLEDQQKDTLLYSKSLEVSVAILPIITQNTIYVKSVDWTDLKAKVYQSEKQHQYNFDYIINAFVDPNAEEKPVQESDSSPLEIKVGTINFADFDLLFNDEVLGVNTHLKLGNLGLAFGNQFNINTFHFPIKKLELANVDFNYTQSKSFPETEESQEESPSPFLEIEQLSLENIKVYYQDKIANNLADVNLGLFFIDNALVDLSSQKIEVEEIGLNNTFANLTLISEKKSTVQDTTQTAVNTKFEWPNWNINVEELAFKNNSIALKTGKNITSKNIFNPEDFKISETNILLNDFSLFKNHLSLDLKEISFKEKCGFNLKELALKGMVTPEQIAISTLKIATNNSAIQTYGKVTYHSINDFINQPKNTKFNVDISRINLNVKDAYYFNEELKENEYLNKFSKHPITGNIKANGALQNIDIADLHLNWGEKTTVDLSGKIKEVLSENNLSFELPNIRFKTDRKSVLSLINEQDFGISVPNIIDLKSDVKGSLSEIKTNTFLKLDKGNISLKGDFKNSKKSQVKGTLKVTDLNLGKLINNPKVGVLGFNTNVNADWVDVHNLNAELSTTFSNLIFDDYNYNPLVINGNVIDGKGSVTTTFKDENLDFDTKTNIKLDSLITNITSAININGVNLQSLKLTEENLKARLNIKVDYKTHADGFTAKAQTENGLLVYQNESFPISNFLINTNIATDSTNVSVESGLLNLNLQANTNPEKISSAINKHISAYFSKNRLDTVAGNTFLNAELSISQDPMLDQVFLKGLNEFEPITFKLSFNELEKKLISSFNIPFVEYQGSSIKNGQFSLNSGTNNFDLDFKVDNVKYNPVNIQNINLQGKVVDGNVLLDFSTADETEKIINIKTEIAANDSLVKFHVNPKDLILNRKPWAIPENNAILFNGNITSKDFELSRNNQVLSFNAQVKEENNNNLAIDFNNFDLLNLIAFLNPTENIASGVVGGNIEVNHFNKEQNLVSNLKIEELNVFQNLLGTLQLNAKTINNQNYDVGLSLQEKNNIDLMVQGSYNAAETTSPLNLKVNLNKLGLSKIEAFGKEYISNASGSISANFNMSGKLDEPIYNGSLNFNKAKLKVNSFNTDFTFPEESIKIDNSSVLLNKFTILDKDENAFVLDGEVLTSDFSNPKFNLSLNSQNLQVLNSTIEDNDLYYGKLFLDADVKIGGDLNIPKVMGTLKIDENSDFTYVIPESEIEAVEREGVVVFVNKKQSNDILTATGNSNTSTGIVTGLDIKTILKVDESAVLNVIIDKKTGDNLRVSGAADLNFGMTPNGRTTLSGKYEVNSGHYEASLYNLVTRKFDIAKGSSILWQGDPLEAKMDIRAIYKVKSSASGLMSSVTSGMDSDALNKYRKKMPFLVYLNLKGELLKPEISFNLDVPEESRGELGGQVYTQVQQLNNREEDLNKQVFSLLVLNQFFPSNISDGSNGGSLSIARDNVNKALSNQLNNYSNKLVGKTGVELGFELDSYTDYTDKGEQNNTQLNVSAQKRLFNDRLTVQVGSGFEIENTSKEQNEKTPIIGNVNIEYALTENRRYRLKGFRKNEYQSVIDGQVIVTGIAFLFNKEFNKFRELWLKENSEKSTK